jgi:hypothetical protein
MGEFVDARRHGLEFVTGVVQQLPAARGSRSENETRPHCGKSYGFGGAVG